MSQSIDKAPEGATHRYEHGPNVDWYRETDRGLYRWQQGSWCASVHKTIRDLMNSCPLGMLEAIPSEPAQPVEDYLTKLARNLHEWPEHTPVVIPAGDGMFEHGATFHTRYVDIYGELPCNIGSISKADWLARRAELQGKPSWADAPEWAVALAQDEDGECKWLGDDPAPYVDGWAAKRIKGAGKGEVLGDWRDTLERRPELTAEDQTVLAAQDLLTSRRSGPGNPVDVSGTPEEFSERMRKRREEVKAAHDWHERGELPPAGIECEARAKGDNWVLVWTIGLDSDGAMVVQFLDDGIPYHGCDDPTRFRPIRTNRQHLCDLINGGLLAAVGPDKIADAILAAGFKRGEV